MSDDGVLHKEPLPSFLNGESPWSCVCVVVCRAPESLAEMGKQMRKGAFFITYTEKFPSVEVSELVCAVVWNGFAPWWNGFFRRTHSTIHRSAARAAAVLLPRGWLDSGLVVRRRRTPPPRSSSAFDTVLLNVRVVAGSSSRPRARPGRRRPRAASRGRGRRERRRSERGRGGRRRARR